MGTTATMKKTRIPMHTVKAKARPGIGKVVVESVEVIQLQPDEHAIANNIFANLRRRRC